MNTKKQLLFVLITGLMTILTGCGGDSPPWATQAGGGADVDDGADVGGADVFKANQLLGTSWETACLLDNVFDPADIGDPQSIGNRPDLAHNDIYHVKYKLSINDDGTEMTLTHRYWVLSDTGCTGPENISYEGNFKVLSVVERIAEQGSIALDHFQVNLELTQGMGWTEQKHVNINVSALDGEPVMYASDCFDLADGDVTDCAVQYTNHPMYPAEAIQS